jgi:S1-C subfamily serine protease
VPGLVKFFDTRQVGLEVTAAPGGVAVSKVFAGKPVARSGLRPGGRVLAINGAKVANPEEFRRSVRRCAMFPRKAVPTIERAGKRPVDMAVAVTD